jgi:hypothetical protein
MVRFASVLRRIPFSIARACGYRFLKIKLPRIDLRTLALRGLVPLIA